MRKWSLGICMVLALLVPLAASAKIHEVQVNETEFTPSELNIKPGDTVRWVWTAGSHTIISGESPEDENAGDLFLFAISDQVKEVEHTFPEAGSYPYFSQEKFESMTGVITVSETTPVDRATWGWLKMAFEEGASSPSPK